MAKFICAKNDTFLQTTIEDNWNWCKLSNLIAIVRKQIKTLTYKSTNFPLKYCYYCNPKWHKYTT